MNVNNPDIRSLSIEKPGINMLGTHILLELHDCDSGKIDDIDHVESILATAAKKAGAVVVVKHFHRFDPHGISGVVVISTSHIAIHSWPEYNFAAIDIFTCGQEMNNELAVSHIVDGFKSENWQLSQVPRGELKSSQLTGHNSLIDPIIAERLELQKELNLDLLPGSTQASTGNNTETSQNLPQDLSEFGLSIMNIKDAEGDSPHLWVSERDYGGERHHYSVKSVIATGSSEYQDYAIIDTLSHGRMLFLDGCSQSAEKDEHIYHESLVQPAMLMHPNPRNILVIGAGEGATAREILYHPTVEKVDLIDLDEEVVNLCIEHLPKLHQGSFHHPKVNLSFMDGYEYVKNCNKKYDVIIIDVVDSLEDGPAQKLYTREFYDLLKHNCLASEGIVVVQSMEFDDLDLKDHWLVHKELKQSYKNVSSYSAYVPSFWSKWGYNIASDHFNFNGLAAEIINRRIKERSLEGRLKFFDGDTFVAAGCLSKRQRLMADSVINGHTGIQPAVNQDMIELSEKKLAITNYTDANAPEKKFPVANIINEKYIPAITALNDPVSS